MIDVAGKKTRLKFIIVGTGRCGTVYVAKLLTAVGIPCSHERIFTNKGIVDKKKDSDVASWSGLKAPIKVVAEASYMAVPYLDHPYLTHSQIIHLVRDPIKVIQSFGNKLQYFRHKPNPWESFIYTHLPELKEIKDPITRCSAYYVLWNLKIEKKDCTRIRLECDIENLLDHLHIPKSHRRYPEIANRFESWTNTKPKLTPEDLITEEKIYNCSFGEAVRDMRKRYGYFSNSNN